MFAASRTPKEFARVMYLVSIVLGKGLVLHVFVFIRNPNSNLRLKFLIYFVNFSLKVPYRFLIFLGSKYSFVGHYYDFFNKGYMKMGGLLGR